MKRKERTFDRQLMVVINCELNPCVCVCGDSRFHFFCFRFTSIVLLSLDTIQHIESLSLLFNNNYYLSFIIIILKLSKDSLRGRSVVFHLSFIICFLPSSPPFASLYYFAYSYVSDDFFLRLFLISVSLCVFLCFAFFSKSFYAFFSF